MSVSKNTLNPNATPVDTAAVTVVWSVHGPRMEPQKVQPQQRNSVGAKSKRI